ncbi:MAG TPA: hypothetical protein VHC90_01265 [Bryobacteraceae bacterium]|nr:hypothetical protein [Bryobacteraceae bacterium]
MQSLWRGARGLLRTHRIQKFAAGISLALISAGFTDIMKLAICGLLLLLWAPTAAEISAAGAEKEIPRSKDLVFEARPREIAPGETAVLRWMIKGATRVVIQESRDSRAGDLREIGRFEGASGTLEVKPKESTTYVALCEGATRYACGSTSVRVRVKGR